jgi:hypothetical protein
LYLQEQDQLSNEQYSIHPERDPVLSLLVWDWELGWVWD